MTFQREYFVSFNIKPEFGPVARFLDSLPSFQVYKWIPKSVKLPVQPCACIRRLFDAKNNSI
jgi:hypothetical protein